MDLNDKSLIQEEMKYAGSKANPVFKDISAEDDDQAPTEVDSMCMRCSSMGKTRLLLTRVPFFKELIIGSFECGSCGFTDSEITSAGRVQEKGAKTALQISCKQDLNRRVVKSESASVTIPHVELEIPPKKGCFTTVEGLITTVSDELEYDQTSRRLIDPETARKIDEFIKKLNKLLEVTEPFQLIIDDPTGNSHIENPKAPSMDPLLHTIYYNRSKAQNEALGLYHVEQPSAEPHLSETPAAGEPGVPQIEFTDEVLEFPSNCVQCNAPCKTNMKVVNIPKFKQVIIMATVCDVCGFKDNEVKPGAGIAKKGKKMTLLVKQVVDLSRDILKSETASCTIPELDLHLEAGTLGGKFTTVEGLLSSVKDQLSNTTFSFTGGDSSDANQQNKLDALCAKLDEIINGSSLDVHVIIDDPAGNSYIQDIYEPEKDPYLTIEEYERTEEMNEELGLTGMNTASTDQVEATPDEQSGCSSKAEENS